MSASELGEWGGHRFMLCLLTDPTPTQWQIAQSPGLGLNCRGQFNLPLLKGKGFLGRTIPSRKREGL